MAGAFMLRSKGTTLGRVEFESEDWPWNYGRFQPAETFSEYAPIFAEAAQASAAGDAERRDSCVRQIIAMELQLVREESGELAGEPDLLWIRGDRVFWRGHSGALRSLL
jgi:hypothetical protein